MRPNIIIAGSGGIGQAAGLILAEKEAFDCHIYFGDRYLETANQAVNFVNEGCQRTGDAEAFLLPESGLSDDLKAVLEKGNIILGIKYIFSQIYLEELLQRDSWNFE